MSKKITGILTTIFLVSTIFVVPIFAKNKVYDFENEIDSTFVDLTDKTKYYYDSVLWAVDNKITKGYADNTFRPQNDCQRREMVIFLWRMSKCPINTTFRNPHEVFNDMNDYDNTTDTFKAVSWAISIGIAKGFSDGGFHPKDSINRKDAMIMMYRMAQKPDYSDDRKMDFKDVAEKYEKVSDTYNAICWAYNKKIANGYSKGEYKGCYGTMLSCLREHIVTFLYRLSNLYKNGNIVFIGDSWVYGTGAKDYINDKFTSITAALMHMQEFNYGIGGFGFCVENKTFDLQVSELKKMMPELEKQLTNIVFICGGVNDWRHGDEQDITPKQMSLALKQLLNDCKEVFPNAKVVLCFSNCMYKGWTESMQIWVDNILSTIDDDEILIIPGTISSINKDNQYYCKDNLHLNSDGHFEYARYISSQIKNLAFK